MSASLYEISKRELKDKNMVDIPWLNERLCSSVGAHLMNIHNIDLHQTGGDGCFYNCGALENFRLHTVLMCPAGFGKTTRTGFYLDPKYGLLRNSGYFNTTMRGTFSPESWAGTKRTNKTDEDGNPIMNRGIFDRFKRGIVGADEFMRFVGMMDTAKVDDFSNEEVYLLKGLDSDTITKDLAVGEINIQNISTTLWVGSRIASIDMKQGLARRVLFHVFTPTPNITREFKRLSRVKNVQKDIGEEVTHEVAEVVESTVDNLNKVHDLDYSELHKFMDTEAPVPHFEEMLLRRIAVGFSIARNTIPEIVMDDEMKGLIKNEIYNRQVIRENPEYEIIRNILREQGVYPVKRMHKFLSMNYQFTYEHIKKIINSLKVKGEVVMEGDYYRLRREGEGREQSKKINIGRYKIG